MGTTLVGTTLGYDSGYGGMRGHLEGRASARGGANGAQQAGGAVVQGVLWAPAFLSWGQRGGGGVGVPKPAPLGEGSQTLTLPHSHTSLVPPPREEPLRRVYQSGASPLAPENGHHCHPQCFQ